MKAPCPESILQKRITTNKLEYSLSVIFLCYFVGEKRGLCYILFCNLFCLFNMYPRHLRMRRHVS
jgi:hypothetical protein